jgi:hypothetical protein
MYSGGDEIPSSSQSVSSIGALVEGEQEEELQQQQQQPQQENLTKTDGLLTATIKHIHTLQLTKR